MEKKISLNSKRFSGKLPTKRRLNLATVGQQHIDWKKGSVGIVLIVILAAIFGKIAVYDRLAAASAAQAAVAEKQAKLEQCMNTIESYGDINELYEHYTYTGMTEEELNRASRVEAIDLLDNITACGAEIASFTISENQMVLQVAGNTLEHINEITKTLEKQKNVSYVLVSSAQTEDDKIAYNYLTGEYEYLTDKYDNVVGQITIYLKNENADETDTAAANAAGTAQTAGEEAGE